MIDHVNNLKFQYLVELSKQGDRCGLFHRALRDYLLHEDVTFGKEPIPFLLMPHFLSPRQHRLLGRVVEKVSAVLEKWIKAYLTDPELRHVLNVDPVRDDLFRIDPGYAPALGIARLDAFLNGYDIKFLEFNTDSPAGIGYTDVLFEGMRKFVELPTVFDHFGESYQSMMPGLYDAMMAAYDQFCANRAQQTGEHDAFPERPTLAILDLDGVPTGGEFRILKRYFEQRGLKALVGDPRHLRMDAEGWPRLDNQRVHLVLRRIVMGDVVRLRDQMETFVLAVRHKRLCMMNPFRSSLAGNKKVLALLLDPDWQARVLTQDERAVVQRTIPWTRILQPGKTTYNDWVVNMPEFISDNRDRLVLKPAIGYGGKDVFIGRETPQKDWDELLQVHLEKADFVVQEYIAIPQEMFPLMEHGILQMRLKKFNINPFALAGRLGGMITRISDASVINVTEGGGLLPSVVGFTRESLFDGDANGHLAAEDFGPAAALAATGQHGLTPDPTPEALARALTSPDRHD